MIVPYYQTELGKLYHGDCLEIIQHVASFAAVVTDPPYMMGSAATRQGKNKFRSRIGEWTNASVWFSAWMKEAWSRLPLDGSMWVCGNWRSMPVVMMAADSLGASISSVVVWDKGWIGVGPLCGLRQRYENVFQIGKENFAVKNRSEPDIWEIKWASARPSGHESEKPVQLMERAIKLSEADRILDPFMGSGTTAAACEKLGRKWIGIEIEENYCEMAAKRLEDEKRQMRLPRCGGSDGR